LISDHDFKTLEAKLMLNIKRYNNATVKKVLASLKEYVS
jgi:hypothetical protein